MPQSVYNFLFNPNHEAPSMTVMIILIVIVIVSAILREYFQNRRR